MLHHRKEDDIFYVSGPKHLTQIDWGIEKHQRVVMACLVQGAYVLRRVINKNGMSDKSPARHWWEFFGFDLLDIASDRSTFGAIYELKPSKIASRGDASPDKAPRFVAAFRGTQSLFDVAHDAILSLESLQKTNRVETAYMKVSQLCLNCNSNNGQCNVWLTGHSLGASIATFVAMKMAEDDEIILNTFLFNPPYLRLDPETVNHKTVRDVVERIRAKLAELFKRYMSAAKERDCYKNLPKWVPTLYVNPNDYICKGFIKYFEHQHHFHGRRPGNVLRVNRNGQNFDLDRNYPWIDEHSVYFLPSADLFANLKLEEEIHGVFKHVKKMHKAARAHELKQWWSEDLQLNCTKYRYDESTNTS